MLDCTRGSGSIDRIFCNIWRKVVESGTLAPLETEHDRRSDHRAAFCKLSLPRKEAFRWESYTYRHYSEEAVKKFQEWIVLHDWAEVLLEEGSERKAVAYQAVLNDSIERFFSPQNSQEEDHRLALDDRWHQEADKAKEGIVQ